MAMRATLARLGAKWMFAPRELEGADAVATLSGDEGEVNPDRWVQQVLLAVEEADFLALGDGGANAGRRVDPRQPGGVGLQSLDRCLWGPT
jgi:hypothetical protein